MTLLQTLIFLPINRLITKLYSIRAFSYLIDITTFFPLYVGAVGSARYLKKIFCVNYVLCYSDFSATYRPMLIVIAFKTETLYDLRSIDYSNYLYVDNSHVIITRNSY